MLVMLVAPASAVCSVDLFPRLFWHTPPYECNIVCIYISLQLWSTNCKGNGVQDSTLCDTYT